MTYLNDWSDSGRDGLLSSFDIKPSTLDGAEILVASYTYEDGKLFEVHGGHCSCYGLEGQWEPEETTKEAILHRLDKGTWGEEDKIANITREAL